MNDRNIDNILSEARTSLEPTHSDRDRMHRKVMGAVGAATVVTAASAGAAKTVGGLASSLGIHAGAASVVKLTVGGLFLGGAIALGVVGVKELNHDVVPMVNTDSAVISDNVSKADNAVIGAKKTSPQISSESGIETATPLRKITDANLHGAVSSAKVPLVGEPSVVVKRNRNRNRDKIEHLKHKSSVESDDALLQEIAMIKSASRAVRQKDFVHAVQLLERYPSAFPRGIMRQERDGLYISALCGAGKTKHARTADRVFRKRYGKAPLMFRVEAQCSAAQEAVKDEK